jgi:ATP-dependent HslUV protease ATP-binding subunit HslU
LIVVAKFAAQVNESSENIGARRLHTIMEALLEDVLFKGNELARKVVCIDGEFVRRKLNTIVEDKNTSRYIL